MKEKVENTAIALLAMVRAVKHGVVNGFDEELVNMLEDMVEKLDFLIESENEKGEQI